MASVSVRERIARAIKVRLEGISGVGTVYRQDGRVQDPPVNGDVELIIGDETCDEDEHGEGVVGRIMRIAVGAYLFRDETDDASAAVSDAKMNVWLAKMEDALIGSNVQLTESDVSGEPICYDLRITGVEISDMDQFPATPAILADVYYRTYKTDPYTAPAVTLLTD